MVNVAEGQYENQDHFIMESLYEWILKVRLFFFFQTNFMQFSFTFSALSPNFC